MQSLLLLALNNCATHMGHGGFVYCTLSQQINVVFSEEHSQQISCPAPFDNCWAEDVRLQLQFCQLWNTLDRNKSERLWGGWERERIKKERKKNSWRCVFENARPDMIGEKSILLKMRDGSTESPSVSDSIKDGAGIISHWKAGTDLRCDLAKN